MTDQTAPKPIVTRAAEATVSGAANVWSFLTEAIKTTAVQNTLGILVALVVGASGLAGYQKVTAATAPTPHLVLQAADAPKPVPVPVVSMGDVDHALQLHCGRVEGKVDEVLRRLPEMKTSPAPRKTAARSGK